MSSEPEFARTILITGSTDGIGRQTAVDLAKNPENLVIIHGRNRGRCEDAIGFIRKQLAKDGVQKSAKLDFVTGDFGEMSEIPKLVAAVKEKFPKLNVLLCNAGVLLPKRQTSKDGLELAFQVSQTSG